LYYNYWLFAKYLPHAIPHNVLSLVPLPIFPCHLFVLILINGRCFSCLNIRIPIHFLQLHFITCFWWIFHGRFSYLDTCVDEKMFAVLSLYSFWWMKLCSGHVVNIRTNNNKYPVRKNRWRSPQSRHFDFTTVQVHGIMKSC
jgi:hypothetical protein